MRFIAVGLGGSGKTVLLTRVRDIAEQSGFRLGMVEAHEQERPPHLLVSTFVPSARCAAR